MNLVKSTFLITLSTLALMSCEKPELVNEEFNAEDRLIRVDNSTSKSNVDKFILEINDEWDVVGKTENGFEIYAIQLWDGEELLDFSTTYYIDQMNSLVVDYNGNDKDKHSFKVILEDNYTIKH